MGKQNNDLDTFIQWIKQREWVDNNSLWNEYIAEFIDEAVAEFEAELLEEAQTDAGVEQNKEF